MNEDRLGDDPGDPPAFTDRVSMKTCDGEDVSTTVVLVVEELTRTSIEDLPLLKRKINIDALNELFEPPMEEDPGTVTGTLQFEYAGCTVTVDSEGRVVAQRSIQGGSDGSQQEGEIRET